MTDRDSMAPGICTHEPEAIDLIGARMLIVARMGTGDDDIVLIRSRMSGERRVVPLHAHADVESFYVLEGRLDVFLDGPAPGWHTIEAGQSITVPGNVKHAVRNVSGVPVDSILATTVRVARFFREIGRPAGASTDLAPAHVAPTAEDIARIRRTAETYGYWMASPTESAAVTGEA